MNNGKKAMWIISGVSALVIGVLLVISCVISLFLLNDLAEIYEIPSSVYIVILLILAFAVMVIVAGGKSLASGFDSLAWDTTLLVIVGLLLILYLVGENEYAGYSSWATVLMIVLCIISLVTKIAQMCIKTIPEQDLKQPTTYNYFSNSTQSGVAGQNSAKSSLTSSPYSTREQIQPVIKEPVKPVAEKPITEKIAELKKLKDEGLIDDEQYKAAVARLLEKI